MKQVGYDDGTTTDAALEIYKPKRPSAVWVFIGFGYFAIELIMHAMLGPVVGPPTVGVIVWYAIKAVGITCLAFAIYLGWLFVRGLATETFRIGTDKVRAAPYTAGRAVSAVERTAQDAAAAFKAGRDR